MGQIERVGKIYHLDAGFSVWEDGYGGLTGDSRDAWDLAFKRQVFARIVQTLNRIGWTCVVPESMVKQYSRRFAENFRFCTKGDLKADLRVSGRCIEFIMFQNVNAPDRPDHDGRYQSNKEDHMPYLLRLEMKRTRQRIVTYLCNVFSGYEMGAPRDGRSAKRGPLGLTAMEFVAGCYATSCHFKGDLTTYKIADSQRRAADGGLVEHGSRVWFADHKGRICTGIAHYNINNMWWVVSGKYAVTNKSCFDLSTSAPADLRRKRNETLRERTLTRLLDEAVKSMAFERAVVLRDLLYPEGVLAR